MSRHFFTLFINFPLYISDLFGEMFCIEILQFVRLEVLICE